MYLYRYLIHSSMNPNLAALRQKQPVLLQQMQAIDRLRRGSLSRPFFKSPGRSAARRGPYYVLQGFFRGQKFSARVPADQAAQVQQDVDNYRRFQALAEDYVTVSDQIARRQDQRQDRKKNSSPRRSPPPSSRKPPPS
jgi:hypothetical protein